MNDLLAFAVAAHGGLDRWHSFSNLRAEVSIDGAIFRIKQQPGLLIGKVLELRTHEQWLTISPFSTPDRRSRFVPGRIVIETTAGEVIEARDNFATDFVGQKLEDAWDKFHVAFFASEALWTYLTLPFLYTGPGFESEEIAPWHEDGEVWRRLRVTFPDRIVSHTRTQVTHFGPDGLMRRHDYTVDILGGATGANYSSNYRDFQGIKMPTTRWIHGYDEAMRKVPEPLLVAVDLVKLTFS